MKSLALLFIMLSLAIWPVTLFSAMSERDYQHQIIQRSIDAGFTSPSVTGGTLNDFWIIESNKLHTLTVSLVSGTLGLACLAIVFEIRKFSVRHSC